YGAHESVIAADFPLGGELNIGAVVPLPCGADGAGPFGYVVGVDAASDGVLPAVEVPELALDGEAAMLHGCPSGDALNIERDDLRRDVLGDLRRDVLKAVAQRVSWM